MAGNSPVSVTVTWPIPRLGHPVPVRVLLVEDHEELAETVADVLRSEGFAVDVALDGHAALYRAGINRYDVVVLDRDLPGVHGDDVCRTLVAEGSHLRVLMLTAASSVEDRVDGLELGAYDYLPKPFAFTELVARIRAVSRRSGTPMPAILACADLRLDPARRTAIRAGRRLALSPKEFAVLEYLMAAGGRIVSAEELLERVWDEAADPFTATVKVTVGRLRAKLGDPAVIGTVREGGYRIEGP
jgi:DNA-binding response OmpR family regulator